MKKKFKKRKVKTSNIIYFSILISFICFIIYSSYINYLKNKCWQETQRGMLMNTICGGRDDCYKRVQDQADYQAGICIKSGGI